MVHRFHFADGAVRHRGRFVETEKLKAERAAGRFLVPGFGSEPAGVLPPSAPDSQNVANISVLPAGDDLLALWEGGSAHVLDPETLETRGKTVFSDELAGAPFSAHPRIGAKGDIWNFGFSSFGGDLIIYHLDAAGGLKRWKLLRGFPRSMAHDFVTTPRHLVFAFSPFLMRRRSNVYLDRFEWDPSEARVYVVIDKDTLEVVRRYELPAAFQFHHANGWEDASGVIRFGACAYTDLRFTQIDAREAMAGVPFSGESTARWHGIALHPDGRADIDVVGGHAEFPVCDPADVETRAPVWSEGRSREDARFANAWTRRAPDGAVVDMWSADADVIMGEHVVARGERRRYAVGVQLDTRKGRAYLSVLDADDLAAGPVYLARLPRRFPAPLHGAWSPA